MLRPQRLMQHLIHKGFRRKGGEFIIKAQSIHKARACIRKACRLGRQQRQPKGRIIRAEMLARMGFKGKHGKRQFGPRRLRCLKHRDMAQMHAIKIAECHCGATRFLGDGTPIAKNLRCHHVSPGLSQRGTSGGVKRVNASSALAPSGASMAAARISARTKPSATM